MSGKPPHKVEKKSLTWIDIWRMVLLNSSPETFAAILKKGNPTLIKAFLSMEFSLIPSVLFAAFSCYLYRAWLQHLMGIDLSFMVFP